MMDAPSITVVILAFNEAESLPQMMHDSVHWLRNNMPDWEIIVVDDGSTDDTRIIAEKWAHEEARVRVFSHETNRGMGAGMKTGISAVKTDYFTIIAGDGQHPTSELGRMVGGLADADIVTTYHENQRELFRRVLSWGFRRAMKWACGIEFVLEGIYLFPTRVAVEEIGLDVIPADTFFFSFELIARALRRGYTVGVRPMKVLPRKHGQSKVAGTRRILRIAGEIRGFRSRLRIDR